MKYCTEHATRINSKVLKRKGLTNFTGRFVTEPFLSGTTCLLAPTTFYNVFRKSGSVLPVTFGSGGLSGRLEATKGAHFGSNVLPVTGTFGSGGLGQGAM